MDANNADALIPTDQEIATAIAEIERMGKTEGESLFCVPMYACRLAELESKTLGSRLLAETTCNAMFTPEEQTEFRDLMDEEAKRALEAEGGEQYRPLLPVKKHRLRELDARTHVLPLIFRSLRNAFLRDTEAKEIPVLVAAALRATRGWSGSETRTTMRVIEAAGKLAAGCLPLHGDGQLARDTLRRIIALEMADDEAPYRGRILYEFWNEQLNMVYSEGEARRRSTSWHVESDRKFVQRERKRALQGSSPDK